ncbi:MAG: hypothetical protein IPM46_05495 [Flavobacteriales bacterium]|nr:hypothetical protein [Flavobacteriales bacterium]
MQNAEPIVLRQVRDFGQLISTTFQFLRRHGGPLFRAILVVGLPATVVGGFLAGGTIAQLQGLQFSGGDDASEVLSLMTSSFALMIPGILVLIVGWLFVVSMSHEYIRAYHLGEHHGLTTGELAKRGASQIGPYLGASILSGLLFALGFLLCILPGFYAWTVLSLALAAHAIERTGGAGALGRSNQLVSGDFWPTLGLVIVVTVINAVINGIVQLPFTIVGIVIGINTGLDGLNGGEASLPSWWTAYNGVATAVQWCVQMLTYPIVAVCMAMKYFSRVEETEGHGLQEKIAGFDRA